MTTQEIQYLKDTIRFIEDYRGSEDIREFVDQKFLYKGKSVLVYITHLIRFSPKFYQYYKDAFASEISFLANRKSRASIKNLPSKLWNFFDKCLRDRAEFTMMVDTATEKITTSSFYSTAELQRMQGFFSRDGDPDAIGQMLTGLFPYMPPIEPFQFTPSPPKKVFTGEDKQKAAYTMAEKIRRYGGEMVSKTGRDKLIKEGTVSKKEMYYILESGLVRGADVTPKFNKDGFTSDEDWDKAVYETAEAYLEDKKRAEPPKTKVAAARNPILPRLVNSGKSLFTGLESKAGIFIKKNLGQHAATLGVSGIGAVVGFGVGGGPGAIVGGGSVFALSKYIKNGGGARLINLGNRGLNAGTRVMQGMSSMKNPVSAKAVKGILLGLLLMLVGVSVLSSMLGGGLPGTSALPSGGGGSGVGLVTGDISQCKFTRGQDNPKELTYKSPLLLSYIQEASTFTNIPPVVLAAFIRVETPSTVPKTDDQIRELSSLVKCPTSPTGALGVMQIQPKGTTGHAADAVANGARLIGKKYEELTIDDYCDVRKNVIMGAGFILKKLSYKGFGDGTKWDPSWNNNKTAVDSLVDGYYGCLQYPSCSSGPFNYGDDVWTSMQNCKPTTNPLALGPVPTDKLEQILYWARQINNALEGSLSGSWNRMVKPFTNGAYTATTRTAAVPKGVGPDGIYWCTNIVIDSYNLAGLKGLGPAHQGVRYGMMEFWKKTPGYIFLPYPGTDLNLVKPGFALFRINPNIDLDHVSIIEFINIDHRGEGKIKTLDSNNVKEWSSTIENGKIVENFFDRNSKIVGFGGISAPTSTPIPTPTPTTVTTTTSGSKPVVVLDPGHSGKDINIIDPATGLQDHDYPNYPELQEVFIVASIVKIKLEAEGYTVLMTKSTPNDTVSLRARADITNNANAALAVSIHTDHGQSWNRFGEIYIQRVGLYRQKASGERVTFDNAAVAQKSISFGTIFAKERSAAELHTVSVKDIKFDGRAGLAAGNIPLVQLFANVPWVYNEVGADGQDQLNEEKINRYAQGLVNSIKKSVPLTQP